MTTALAIAPALLSMLVQPLQAPVARPAESPPGVGAAPVEPAAPVAPAVAAVNGFGTELFKALAKANTEGNLIVSPYSMTIALTMAAEGARE